MEGDIVAITKPFYRIIRPMVSSDVFCPYVLDNRFADDRSMLCRSYKILESDLKKIFEYIEPSEDNKATYSHRIYELFLRASTEFESNCKRILEVNGYVKSTNLNICDYRKIDKATKLSEYEVYIDIWRPQRLKIQPFLKWKNVNDYSLSWYKEYNAVKHNRQTNFDKANINNLIQAVAAIYTILYSQFGVYSFNPYQQLNMVEENDYGAMFSGESIFSIIPPIWSNNEKYNFEWNTLKEEASPFEMFNFKKQH